MAGSILDALISQARAAISRAYMVAGLVPALVVALGWQLNGARSLAALQKNLEPLLTLKTTALPAAALVNVIAVALLGALFYGGRGLVLRLLQDGPRGALSFVRRELIERQVKRWWASRHRQAGDEHHLNVLNHLVRLDFTFVEEQPPARASTVVDLTRSVNARRYITEVVKLESQGGWNDDPLDVTLVVAGLHAFYSAPPDKRATEADEWQRLYETEKPQEVIDRIRAAMFRRVVESTAKAQEQPEQEEQLAPTLLGNRVAALDDYAERRYGIATSTLWTRLWGVLGQAERQEIANAQLRVEMLANMAVAFAAVAVLVAVGSVYRAVRVTGMALVIDWWAVAFTLACLGLALAAYKSAVYAFGGVADGIIRLVDLHRVRVLMTFGLAPPETFEEERAMFRELNAFFSNAISTNLDKRKLKSR